MTVEKECSGLYMGFSRRIVIFHDIFITPFEGIIANTFDLAVTVIDITEEKKDDGDGRLVL